MKATKGGECALNLAHCRLGNEGARALGAVLAGAVLPLTALNMFGNTGEAGPLTAT